MILGIFEIEQKERSTATMFVQSRVGFLPKSRMLPRGRKWWCMYMINNNMVEFMGRGKYYSVIIDEHVYIIVLVLVKRS